MPRKDLRQMKKKGINKEDIKKVADQAKINVGEIHEENIQSFEEVMEKYGDKSEAELMGDLEQMVSKGREEGTFSDEMLEAFAKNVMPMMDEEQKKRLESITRMLRMNKI